MSIQQLKTAKIRLISSTNDQLDLNNNQFASHYYDYIYSQNRIEVVIRCLRPQQTQNDKNNVCQTPSNSYESDESNTDLDGIFSFLESKKINVYKNILLGFKNHILSCKDANQIMLYEELSEEKFPFYYVQKRIQQNFKNFRRFSLKLKNLMTSKNLQKIFISFLQNSEKLWLDQSKIKDKDIYREYILLLLKVYQSNLLVNHIKYYKK